MFTIIICFTVTDLIFYKLLMSGNRIQFVNDPLCIFCQSPALICFYQLAGIIFIVNSTYFIISKTISCNPAVTYQKYSAVPLLKTPLSEPLFCHLPAPGHITVATGDHIGQHWFWGILKRERYYGKRFTERCTLVKMIEDYIDYYNNIRLQRNLGILTPMEKHEIYLQAA